MKTRNRTKTQNTRNKIKIFRLYITIVQFFKHGYDCNKCNRGRMKISFIHNPNRFGDGNDVYECDKCSYKEVSL